MTYHYKILRHELSRTMIFSYTTIILLSHLRKSTLIKKNHPRKKHSTIYFPHYFKNALYMPFFTILDPINTVFTLWICLHLLCPLEYRAILEYRVQVSYSTEEFRLLIYLVLRFRPKSSGMTKHHVGDIVHHCITSEGTYQTVPPRAV